MKAPIVEIFSSIQGEGLLIGKRQIFVRFAGCNLNCNYCDTKNSKSKDSGILTSVEDVISKINKLKTKDCHSISFTGGEPSLYPEFINEVSKKTDLDIMLETNGTLTDNINKIDNLDFVSLDIKLPEHFDNDWSNDIFINEIKSVNLLTSKSIKVYCKLVILPSTKINSIDMIMKKLSAKLISRDNIQFVIQPSSPISDWKSSNEKLFEFSEVVGQYFEVSTIPQIHKYLNIE